MHFGKGIRLKLIIGFLIGVLSIGLFSIYTQFGFDAAMDVLDKRAGILKTTDSLAFHTKDSFNVLNLYLFTDDPAELAALRARYAVSSHDAARSLDELKGWHDDSMDPELLDLLEEYYSEDDRILKDMIYVHDLRLVEVDAEALSELEDQERSLLLHSRQVQTEMQGILDSITGDAYAGFERAILEFDMIRDSSRVILVIIVIFSSGLAIIIANSLSRPISQLRDMASTVGKGNLDVEIRVQSKDELGELASEFNSMVGHIKRSEQVILEKNKKLSEANEKLKELDKEKDEFIAIAAHELKNPIAAIMSFGQLVASEKTLKNKSKIKEFARYINDCAKDLNNLALNLVDSARLSLGKLSMDIQPVPLSPFLKGVEKELKVFIRHNGVKPVFSIAKVLPQVSADPDRLMQVIRNLVVNAIHYTPKKGTIEVGAVRRGSVVEFSVRDTGAGIPKEKQGRIFQRFFQAGNKATGKVSGSGLGLSICKGLVENMKGKIWFRSEVGKGTTFYFTVPVA